MLRSNNKKQLKSNFDKIFQLEIPESIKNFILEEFPVISWETLQGYRYERIKILEKLG